MKKVLVTGGLGYIGCATNAALKAHGYTPIITDKKIGSSTENILKMLMVLLRDRPVGTIHLSAKKSIGESKKRPIVYYWNNVSSTVSIALLCRLFNLPVVFASSASVYEPTNPYAKSKLIEEKIICRVKSYVILRYFNIGGKAPGVSDTAKQNIFSILDNMQKEGITFTVNSPSSTRDYTHVLDIAEANILALEHALGGNRSLLTDVFSGAQHSVLDVIEEYRKNNVIIAHSTNSAVDKTIYPKYDKLDLLGWAPTRSFSDIVRSEIEMN
jgi:UDP-glucose 4-epimerase